MKLEKYLEEFEWKCTDFARNVGVCPTTLKNIIREKFIPKLETALRIEIVTGGKVKAEDLLPLETLEKIKSTPFLTHTKN